MQLTPNLINNNSNYICTRSPSGLVLEVTSISSGNSGLQVVAASPVNQNLCQYFVITELPGQESFTIENAAATGTFLQPTNPAISAPLTLIASSRRFADRSQEWKLTLEKNDNDRDYYLIESVRYPGNVLALDQRTRTVRLNIRGQSPQPAVDQYWALIPAGAPPDYLLDKDSTELQDLKDNVAGLKEEIADKDSLIKDKDEEITRLKEIIEALSVPTPSAVEPDDATEATIAVVLFDFEATEDFEMSLVEGEYIKNIEECDDGWWSGVGGGGKTGLFPSHFVRLIEATEPPSPRPEIPTIRVGDTAIALYDYPGAEDNQVTFREGDTITDLVSEHWLRGRSPCGEVGLFPAIYVNVQRSQQ